MATHSAVGPRRDRHGRFVAASSSLTRNLTLDVIEETPPPPEPRRRNRDRLQTIRTLGERRAGIEDTEDEIAERERRLEIAPILTTSNHRQEPRQRHVGYAEVDPEEGNSDRASIFHAEAKTSAHPSAELGRDPPEFWYRAAPMAREQARLLWWKFSAKTRKSHSTATKSYQIHCALHGHYPHFPAG